MIFDTISSLNINETKTSFDINSCILDLKENLFHQDNLHLSFSKSII